MLQRVPLLALPAAVLAAAAALAHQAPQGWQYDARCCSKHDCQQVAHEAVRRVSAGFIVFISPGTHIMVPAGAEPVQEVIAVDDRQILPGGDEHFHVCISARSREVLRVYVPIKGGA